MPRSTVDKFSKLLKDIWPNERDILVRPERLKYVRRIVRPKACVFCQAATTSSRQKKLVLYRDKHAMVLMNKYPYNNGHLLVMPKEHVAHMEDLSDESFQQINAMVRSSVQILKKVYGCEGLNVGLNLGAIAGAGIPDHMHYHVIPRWGGDTNFFPLIAKTKMVVEDHKMTFKKLQPHFKKLEDKARG